MDKDQLEEKRKQNNKGRDLQKYFDKLEAATTIEEVENIIGECLDNFGTVPIEFRQKLNELKKKTLPNEKIVDLGYREPDYQNSFQSLYNEYQEALSSNDKEKAQRVKLQLEELGYNVKRIEEGVMKR